MCCPNIQQWLHAHGCNVFVWNEILHVPPITFTQVHLFGFFFHPRLYGTSLQTSLGDHRRAFSLIDGHMMFARGVNAQDRDHLCSIGTAVVAAVVVVVVVQCFCCAAIVVKEMKFRFLLRRGGRFNVQHGPAPTVVLAKRCIQFSFQQLVAVFKRMNSSITTGIGAQDWF